MGTRIFPLSVVVATEAWLKRAHVPRWHCRTARCGSGEISMETNAEFRAEFRGVSCGVSDFCWMGGAVETRVTLVLA